MAASSTPNAFSITVNVTYPTAGVLLRNGNWPSVFDTVFSRGEGTSPGSTTVIWSPCIQFSGTAQLIADNSAAASLLASNGQFVAGRIEGDGGVNAVIEHGTVSGGEQFRFIC